jgi:hypothetical protein
MAFSIIFIVSGGYGLPVHREFIGSEDVSKETFDLGYCTSYWLRLASRVSLPFCTL